MKKLLLLFVFLCTLSTINAQNDQRIVEIEDQLNEILIATKAAGYAVAVVEGNKTIYAKGFGYRDYENKIPVDENTLFAIGSSTKAFTSAILGQLENDGELSLNDKPSKYITDLNFYNDDMDNSITIKDLMSHRTGLPRHDWSWYLFPTKSKDSLMQRIQHQEPFTGIREKWHYNNFMFLLQGIVAERVTGKSWEDNIRDRFFKPLKMTRSNVSIDELLKSSNAAIGYGLKKDSIITKSSYYRISGMSPAGSINSSVNEMTNWLKMWIEKGKFEEKEVLPEAYINDAITPQMVMGGGVPDEEFPDMHFSTYGYGWMMSSYRGHYRVNHGGNIDGFSANVAFYPSDSLGIVVLANQNGSAIPGLVRNTIADLLLNTEKTDWVERFKERNKKNEEEENIKEEEETTLIKSSHSVFDFAGDYFHPGYGKFNITVDNDSLYANFKLMKFYLKNTSHDVFEPFEVTDEGIDTSESGALRFNFSSNDAGEISNAKIKVEATLDPIAFKRTPKLFEVEEEALESYVGEYEISGMTIKFYIKNKNKLYLFVPGQPEYELFPTGNQKFNLKALDGYKVEFISEGNTISGVKMIQPNGTFKAQKK